MYTYINKSLHCDNIPLNSIAKKYGTPVFVYDRSIIRNNFTRYTKAFASVPHRICYAVKANSNISILRDLKNLGSGADIVSGGELFKALRAGIDPGRIVYSGVGKTEEEIRYALREEILMFNVESLDELIAINKVARKLMVKAPVAFRINPDIDALTHKHITTGKKENKFGIHFPHVIEHFLEARKLMHIEIVGIQAHIGSQLLTVQPYIATVKKLVEIIKSLEMLGIRITYVDIGGGLGIQYNNREHPPAPHKLARAVIPMIRKTGLTLILEPGRSICGDAGVLLTRVLYKKKTDMKHFIVVDAAMNDLMRPVLYDAYHDIIPVQKRKRSKIIRADIVGPICETGDHFTKGRPMPEPEHNDILCIKAAGAYGFAMSSQYNSRLRAAEVMVTGSKTKLIREREDYGDLVDQEV
ncbi:MAG: diaminopimelate decarboxylase [bacterium]